MLDIKANDDYGDRIYRVLSNPLRIWRTVDQISREADVPRAVVLRFLRETDQDIVRSNYTDKSGEARFSTWTNYYANASWIEKLRGYLGVGVD